MELMQNRFDFRVLQWILRAFCDNNRLGLALASRFEVAIF